MKKHWILSSLLIASSIQLSYAEQAQADQPSANTKNHPHAYVDPQSKALRQDQAQYITEDMVLKGKDDKVINVFDTEDPRTRIVYFGYSRCADLCPTSLAMLGAALGQIDQKYLKDIRPIFITLDPERDSADDSSGYAAYFHPNIEGVAGSLDTTKKLTDLYGVVYQKANLETSGLKYAIDHNSFFYFLAPDGTLIKKVPHTLTPQPIIQAIIELDKE